MRIPKKIRIKGELWKIKWKSDLKHNGELVYGLSDFDTRTITLNRDMPRDLYLHSFIHEVTHATLYELHVEVNIELEEVTADGIGYVFSKVFNQLNAPPKLK